MNLKEILKNGINTICAKYLNEKNEIEYLPIFYIAGSQTLPPPLEPEEEIIEEPEVLNFDIMLCTRGMTVFHRMWYALEHSTIEYLRTELERVNKELGLLNVKIYSTSWYDKENEIRREEPELEFLDEVIVDLKNMVILKNTAREKKITNIFKSTYFKHVSSYEGFLDALVMYQDRAFMNSRHIIDKFKDSDFYDVDYWMQRLNKFEFYLELK